MHLPRPIGASAYYRAILPYRHCRDILFKEGIELLISAQIRLGDKFDAVIAHREVPLEILSNLNNRRWDGCKFVWDTDDDLWNVPEWSSYQPDRHTLEFVDMAMAMSDHIVASTVPLAQVIGGRLSGDCHAHTVHVAPNLMDLNDWQQPKHHRKCNGEVQVLLSGSNTHSRDWDEVTEAIKYVSNKFKDKAHFTFFGYFPEKIRAALWPKFATHIDWLEFGQYYKTLEAIDPHIGICPLTDCKFNESKSNIKHMEMVIAGAAVLCSESVAYDGAAILVENSTANWIEQITKSVDAVLEGRHTNCERADRERIVNEFTWQNSAAKNDWLDIFRTIVS